MSKAACLKKALCDPPARASSESMDLLIPVLQRLVDDGQLEESEFTACLEVAIAIDERTIDDYKRLFVHITELVDNAERNGRKRKE